MSKVIAKTVTQKLSEKFEKDLEKFFVWAVKNEYTIKDDNSEIEWSMDLLKTIEFTEPGRNKLDSFIKVVKDTYTIENETGEVDDAKLMAKEFKDAPKEKSPRKKKAESEKVKAVSPKKVKKVVEEVESESEVEVEKAVAPKKVKKTKAVVEVETKPKKVKKTKAVVTPEVESEVEVETEVKVKKTKAVVEKAEAPKKVKKAKTEVIETETATVKLDMTLDTENTDWLDVIEFWTNDLIKAFGKPHKTGGKKDDNHTFEWKLEINGGIYSIYDWDNTDSFEDTTWHIATHTESEDENKENMKILYNYINSMLPEEDTKLDFENLEVESENESESESESVSESDE